MYLKVMQLRGELNLTDLEVSSLFQKALRNNTEIHIYPIWGLYIKSAMLPCFLEGSAHLLCFVRIPHCSSCIRKAGDKKRNLPLEANFRPERQVEKENWPTQRPFRSLLRTSCLASDSLTLTGFLDALIANPPECFPLVCPSYQP